MDIGIVQLDVSHRKIKHLPDLSSVDKLRCADNKIRKFPRNKKLYLLFCISNRFKSIKYICNIAIVSYAYGNKVKDHSYCYNKIEYKNKYQNLICLFFVYKHSF
jgi:hypothetical protein